MSLLLILTTLVLVMFGFKYLFELKNELKKISARLDNLEGKAGHIPVPPAPAVPAPAKAEPPLGVPVSSAAVVEPDWVIRQRQAANYQQTPKTPELPHVIVKAITDFFTGGNLIVRIGLIILFIGLSFLLKLAINHGLVPIELRLTGVAAGAIALIVLGWRLRINRAGYALSLLGGGIAILYLNIFAALRLYSLLSPGAALVLMVAVVIFSGILAVKLDAQALAVIGICGGFMAPIITSTQSGNHVLLFSYFLLLNLGILGIAWFKAWRTLNVLGFFFTFTLGFTWGIRGYTPDLFATTEPFLIAFFLLYSLIPLLFASRIATDLKGFVDTTLIFGTPLVAFGLQVALVRHFESGMALSSLGLAVYYIVIATILMKHSPAVYKMLAEATLALAIIFITLTIPLKLSNKWTTLSWAIEGAALVWVGLRQKRILARSFGILILLASCFSFFAKPAVPSIMIFNPFFVGALTISLAFLFSSFQFMKQRQDCPPLELPLEHALFIIGLFWWFFAGLSQIGTSLELSGFVSYTPHAYLFFATVTAAGGFALKHPLGWDWPGRLVYCLLPVLALTLTSFGLERHSAYTPFNNLGWILWPAALIVQFWFLKKEGHADTNPSLKFLHAGSLLFVVALLTFQTMNLWIIPIQQFFMGISAAEPEYIQAKPVWMSLATHIWSLIALSLVCFAGDKIRWPFKAYETAYKHLAGTPLVFCLWLWIFSAAIFMGDILPVPYLPFFNPLEMAQAFFFLAALAWIKSLPAAMHKKLKIGLGLTAFFWINVMLTRTISYWARISYAWSDLYHSLLWQTALTIFWISLAMAVMVIGTRKTNRPLWMGGATLLGLTILKLFFVDLSNSQTVARVVSFVGAGVLILVIGYFAPLSPKIIKEAIK